MKNCENCKYWEREKAENNLAPCVVLSAKDHEDYPDVKITGVEAWPICGHDGRATKFETKNWFCCSHFNSLLNLNELK